MFSFKNKKDKFCFIGMIISLFVLLIVFVLTDDLTGEKEFSQYTEKDWEVAIPPLIIMAVSAISTLTFSAIILIPIILSYPALIDYVTNKKFSDYDENTEYLIFDHNELKRACCYFECPGKLWFSVKEYNLKNRKWHTLEQGRYIENYTTLLNVLKNEFNYDIIKHYIRISENNFQLKNGR